MAAAGTIEEILEMIRDLKINGIQAYNAGVTALKDAHITNKTGLIEEAKKEFIKKFSADLQNTFIKNNDFIDNIEQSVSNLNDTVTKVNEEKILSNFVDEIKKIKLNLIEHTGIVKTKYSTWNVNDKIHINKKSNFIFNIIRESNNINTNFSKKSSEISSKIEEFNNVIDKLNIFGNLSLLFSNDIEKIKFSDTNIHSKISDTKNSVAKLQEILRQHNAEAEKDKTEVKRNVGELKTEILSETNPLVDELEKLLNNNNNIIHINQNADTLLNVVKKFQTNVNEFQKDINNINTISNINICIANVYNDAYTQKNKAKEFEKANKNNGYNFSSLKSAAHFDINYVNYNWNEKQVFISTSKMFDFLINSDKLDVFLNFIQYDVINPKTIVDIFIDDQVNMKDAVACVGIIYAIRYIFNANTVLEFAYNNVSTPSTALAPKPDNLINATNKTLLNAEIVTYIADNIQKYFLNSKNIVLDAAKNLTTSVTSSSTTPVTTPAPVSSSSSTTPVTPTPGFSSTSSTSSSTPAPVTPPVDLVNPDTHRAIENAKKAFESAMTAFNDATDDKKNEHIKKILKDLKTVNNLFANAVSPNYNTNSSYADYATNAVYAVSMSIKCIQYAIHNFAEIFENINDAIKFANDITVNKNVINETIKYSNELFEYETLSKFNRSDGKFEYYSKLSLNYYKGSYVIVDKIFKIENNVNIENKINELNNEIINVSNIIIEEKKGTSDEIDKYYDINSLTNQTTEINNYLDNHINLFTDQTNIYSYYTNNLINGEKDLQKYIKDTKTSAEKLKNLATEFDTHINTSFAVKGGAKTKFANKYKYKNQKVGSIRKIKKLCVHNKNTMKRKYLKRRTL